MIFKPCVALALSCMLLVASPVSAATFTWDGSAGDGFWTNGPQNNSGGGFPANPSGQGANWNDGTPGQLAPPDATTPGSNMIDYSYTGHDWDIDNAVINEDVQIKLDGGTLDISNSNVSLLPSSANATANLSGLNLGQNGTPTIGTVTNSTVSISRSNQNGNAFRLRNGSSLDVVNSTINVTSELGSGNLTVEVGGASLTADSTSVLDITGGLEVTNNAANIAFNNATMNAGWIRLNSGGETTQNLMFDFLGGTVTLSDSNPLRDNSSFEGSFDWIGGIGSGFVVHTNPSNSTSDLAFKTSQGYFSINGTRINPTTDPSVSGIAALNTELATLTVGSAWFQILEGGGNQTLVLVPEPATTALAYLGCLAILGMARRERFA